MKLVEEGCPSLAYPQDCTSLGAKASLPAAVRGVQLALEGQGGQVGRGVTWCLRAHSVWACVSGGCRALPPQSCLCAKPVPFWYPRDVQQWAGVYTSLDLESPAPTPTPKPPLLEAHALWGTELLAGSRGEAGTLTRIVRKKKLSLEGLLARVLVGTSPGARGEQMSPVRAVSRSPPQGH